MLNCKVSSWDKTHSNHPQSTRESSCLKTTSKFSTFLQVTIVQVRRTMIYSFLQVQIREFPVIRRTISQDKCSLRENCATLWNNFQFTNSLLADKWIERKPIVNRNKTYRYEITYTSKALILRVYILILSVKLASKLCEIISMKFIGWTHKSE